jgi:hypothetical protein
MTPGDLARCIDASPFRYPTRHPVPLLQQGKTYRVAQVFSYNNALLLEGEGPHFIIGCKLPTGWDAARFVKVGEEVAAETEREFAYG